MLTEYLATNVFQFMVVVIRLTPIFLFFPGLSGSAIPAQFRMGFVLAFAFVLMPLIQPLLPPEPEALVDFLLIVFHEFLIGGFFGAVLVVLTTASSVAGLMVSRQSGLMNSQIFDPITASQGAVITGLISNLFLLLMFATGLHHVILTAIADAYFAFPPGVPLMFDDFTHELAILLTEGFALGVRMAGPFLIFGLTFQITLGIVSRISPQTNVMLVAMPAQNILGFIILTIALPGMMLIYIRHYEDVVVRLFGPTFGGG